MGSLFQNGHTKKPVGRNPIKNPHQIAIDSLGNVYLPDKDGSTVLKFDSNGNFITRWGSNGTGDGQFNTPHGVAIDPQNNVFVTDMDNSRVQEFNSDGVFLLKWGSQGSDNGQFSKVTPGIDVDSSGYVYVIGGLEQMFRSSTTTASS